MTQEQNPEQRRVDVRGRVRRSSRQCCSSCGSAVISTKGMLTHPMWAGCHLHDVDVPPVKLPNASQVRSLPLPVEVASKRQLCPEGGRCLGASTAVPKRESEHHLPCNPRVPLADHVQWAAQTLGMLNPKKMSRRVHCRSQSGSPNTTFQTCHKFVSAPQGAVLATGGSCAMNPPSLAQHAGMPTLIGGVRGKYRQAIAARTGECFTGFSTSAGKTESSKVWRQKISLRVKLEDVERKEGEGAHGGQGVPSRRENGNSENE